MAPVQLPPASTPVVGSPDPVQFGPASPTAASGTPPSTTTLSTKTGRSRVNVRPSPPELPADGSCRQPVVRSVAAQSARTNAARVSGRVSITALPRQTIVTECPDTRLPCRTPRHPPHPSNPVLTSSPTGRNLIFRAGAKTGGEPRSPA